MNGGQNLICGLIATIPNQRNILSFLCRLLPRPLHRKYDCKDISLVLGAELARPRGAHSITTGPNAYAEVQSHHALRAL